MVAAGSPTGSRGGRRRTSAGLLPHRFGATAPPRPPRLPRCRAGVEPVRRQERWIGCALMTADAGSDATQAVSSCFRTAVVPAAGLGTRFLPATKTVPKELLPVVDTPGIELVAAEAAGSGAQRLVI